MNKQNDLYILTLVIKREFKRIFERKTIFIPSLLLPVILFALFGLIYKNALVREIPIAICNNDNGEISLIITRYVESTSSMRIVEYVNSVKEIESEIKKGKIDGAFYFPANMENNIKAGGQGKAILFINSVNLIKSNYLMNDGLKILKTVSAGVLLKKYRSSGMTYEQAMSIINPVKIESQILYNPNYSYETYLVPGITTFILMMVVMLVAALAISSEVTHETFNELAILAKNKIYIIITGKVLPHLFIHSINIILLFYFIFPIFNIEGTGSIITSISLTIFFSMICILIGLAISSIFKNQMLATEIVLFIITPAFIFSGLTYPLWSMPGLIRTYAQLIPYTHFLSALLKIFNMNASINYVIKELVYLSSFGISSIIILWFGINHRLTENNKEGTVK